VQKKAMEEEARLGRRIGDVHFEVPLFAEFI
jgi:hypothetical protein